VKRRTRPQSLVQSVGRSFDLLEALAGAGELGLVELAGRTGLQPSTAHRLLSTLADRGYVLQNAYTGRYLLGYKLLELASSVHQRTAHLRAIARPHLVSIQKITAETASLTLLEPPSVVYVDQIEGSWSVRMFAHVGAAVLPYTTAAGKAMLAFTPAAQVAEICGPEPLEQLTPHTITTVAALADELARVRRRGYAIDNEEHEAGVSCVAAPIFDHASLVRAAISVSAPTPRIHSADTAELGELLTNRAAEISRALGFDGAEPRQEAGQGS
jgi:IclR family acetate operon transcriptional repressor